MSELSSLQILRIKITAEVLANIYSHIHEDTEEKVKRARMIAHEIIFQELGEEEIEIEEIEEIEEIAKAAAARRLRLGG